MQRDQGRKRNCNYRQRQPLPFPATPSQPLMRTEESCWRQDSHVCEDEAAVPLSRGRVRLLWLWQSAQRGRAGPALSGTACVWAQLAGRPRTS